MAKHLARIHGTEEDKPDDLIKHLYRHPVRQAELKLSGGGGAPAMNPESLVDKEQAFEDFLCFFEDMFVELSKFGVIEQLHVCDNLGDHMIGHVYCKFSDEEEASDALQVMNGRFYDGRKIEVEFSPVTDFREARCRDFDEDTCSRGGYCNFMHIKPVPMALIRSLEADCEEDRRQEAMKRESERHREKKKRKRSRREEKKRSHRRRRGGDSDDGSGRSRSRSYSRSRSRSRSQT